MQTSPSHNWRPNLKLRGASGSLTSKVLFEDILVHWFKPMLSNETKDREENWLKFCGGFVASCWNYRVRANHCCQFGLSTRSNNSYPNTGQQIPRVASNILDHFIFSQLSGLKYILLNKR